MSNNFQMIAQTAANLGMAAINSGKHRQDSTFLALAAVSGALSALAISVGQNPSDADMPEDQWNPAERVNGDTMLFAALLTVEAVTAGSSHRVDTGKVMSVQEVNFGPETVYSALVNFEKLTGRKPDDKLCTNMVKEARAKADTGVVMLKDFMDAKTRH